LGDTRKKDGESASEKIKEKALELLKAGIIPWSQPSASPLREMLYTNRKTGKPYSALNRMFGLGPEGQYVSFQQAQDMGGYVKKDAEGYRSFSGPCHFNASSGLQENTLYLVGHDTENIPCRAQPSAAVPSVEEAFRRICSAVRTEKPAEPLEPAEEQTPRTGDDGSTLLRKAYGLTGLTDTVTALGRRLDKTELEWVRRTAASMALAGTEAAPLIAGTQDECLRQYSFIGGLHAPWLPGLFAAAELTARELLGLAGKKNRQ